MDNLDAVLSELGIAPQMMAARGLRRHEEAVELEWVETIDHGKQFRLIPAAAQAWRDMKAGAANDGIALMLVSAHRSVARQVEIIREKLAAGRQIDEILTLVAPPGYSEHHTGRAIDIAIPEAPELEEEFELTEAFHWLVQHAGRFGFTLSYPRGNRDGYKYEPWHWCFQPTLAHG
ncbi:MAG: M15 family metallopeptidase [Betaproteobacteria bacterium]|nr:M15 family metallopeptidase [Betaproteobacteria bacterium]